VGQNVEISSQGFRYAPEPCIEVRKEGIELAVLG
jgi:hypothetical protein